VLVEKLFDERARSWKNSLNWAVSAKRLGPDGFITYLYTGAVRKIKEVVASGELGGFYFDAVRTGLGLFSTRHQRCLGFSSARPD